MRTLLASCLFLIALLVVVPVPAHAELVGPLDPIFPAACSCENVQGPDGAPVQSAPGFGCVLQVVQNIVRLVITLGIVLCVLALMYTGFQWMTAGANAQKRTQGKNLFLNTLVGLVIILTSWLIVDFVMKTFYNDDDPKFGPWHSILASTGNDQCLLVRKPTPLTEGGLDVITGGGGGGGGIGVTNPGSMTDSQAREALAAGGVEIYNWPATQTLANTRIDTIYQAIEIKKACNCTVLVTATTGGSHAGGEHSHAAGYKIDLEDRSDLNAFLQRLRPGPNRGSDPRYYDSCGNEYVREDTHWDITVNKGVCSLGG